MITHNSYKISKRHYLSWNHIDGRHRTLTAWSGLWGNTIDIIDEGFIDMQIISDYKAMLQSLNW